MKRGWKLLGLGLFLMGVFGPTVQAEEAMGGYTIEGVPHSKQLDKNVGYFYLKENPGERDSIKLKLINNSSEDKTLQVKVTDANTNPNGIVDYSGNIKNHNTLKTPLTSILTASQKEVIVPKESTIETTLTIDMPSNKQEGVIIGGILVTDETDKKENSKKELSVKNEYSYTIGVVLTNLDEVKMNENISVELEKVGPKLYDGKKIVQADILNPNPYLFGKAQVSGKILEKNSSKLVKEEMKKEVSIAPYSVFPFQLDWKKDELKPGKYIFKGTVETKDNKWDFEKEFEITSEKAKLINKESVFTVYIPKWLQYSAVISSTVTVIGTIWLFISRGRKENE
ncbi:TPA: DUF916 and DUF3324 domain-containing protein [Enterococcus faecium]